MARGKPLTEGMVNKGGVNPPESQITERPPPPKPLTPPKSVDDKPGGTSSDAADKPGP